MPVTENDIAKIVGEKVLVDNASGPANVGIIVETPKYENRAKYGFVRRNKGRQRVDYVNLYLDQVVEIGMREDSVLITIPREYGFGGGVYRNKEDRQEAERLLEQHGL
jgi:hypothetical protein